MSLQALCLKVYCWSMMELQPYHWSGIDKIHRIFHICYRIQAIFPGVSQLLKPWCIVVSVVIQVKIVVCTSQVQSIDAPHSAQTYIDQRCLLDFVVVIYYSFKWTALGLVNGQSTCQYNWELNHPLCILYGELHGRLCLFIHVLCRQCHGANSE